MIAFLLGAALAGPAFAGNATLHVGVLAEAGDVYDLAADGAAGQCSVGPSLISCPADGPVTFRWGPGGPWSLVEVERIAVTAGPSGAPHAAASDPADVAEADGGEGEARPAVEEPAVVAAPPGAIVVRPGERVVAFALASEEARAEERRRLGMRPLDPETVRSLFLRTGEVQPPPPSMGMIEDLIALADHPDPRVRRAVVDALVPYWRHTASDPLPPSAPELVPEHLIAQLADDEDHRVRRRLASRLRDLRDPSAPLAGEARDALLTLVTDDRGAVQRAATASLAQLGSEEEFPAELSWEMALGNVTRAGPPGRAAANTLKVLRPHLDPSRVDAVEAVHIVLQHHPERAWHVWSAWRAEVPFRQDWVDRLFHETVGLDRRLLRHWARTAPGALAAALTRWEPASPHTARYEVVRAWLDDAPDPALREALGLPLDLPAGAEEGSGP